MKEKGNKGITRREFIVKTGAAGAALGAAVMAPSLAAKALSAQRDYILIGHPNPSTGPLAGFGEASPWADKKAIDAINKDGGLFIKEYGKKVPVQLKMVDTESNPTKAAELASKYLRISGDWPLFLLLNFYKSYRAYVRGKVVSFRLDDPRISPAEKTSALEEAQRYFLLAHHYSIKLNRPSLFITCGLMGTGKSTIAKALAEALGWERISSDHVRKELAHLSIREHRLEKFHQGIYSPDFSRKTYQALLARAKSYLAAGKSVILDASFKKQKDRQEALVLARQADADFLALECFSSEGEIQRRLSPRLRDDSEPSDGRWELIPEQKKDFEKVEGLDPDLYLSLNTERTIEECLESLFQYLLTREGREWARKTGP